MQEHLFPVQSKEYILSFQFSFWYPLFFNHTIKSTIIRPLPDEFVDYLNADGVFVPEGSEDVYVRKVLFCWPPSLADMLRPDGFNSALVTRMRKFPTKQT